MAKKTTKKDFEIKTVDVTRSYSRKLNMSAYGGKQYETADLFSQRTAKDVPAEDEASVSKELFKMCVKEIDLVIKQFEDQANEIEAVKIPKPAKRKSSLDLGLQIEKEEMEEIIKFVNDLTLVKTATELKKAAASIKKAGETLSATQKKYLSLYYKKRVAAIKE